MLRDDAPAAVRYFETALHADPDGREAHFGLGQALRLIGKPAEARPHFKAAREREHLEWLVRGARTAARRDDPAVLRTIGVSCLAIGRRDLARAWFRRALSQRPGDPEIQSALLQFGPD